MKLTPRIRTRLAVLMAGATMAVGIPLAHADTTSPIVLHFAGHIGEDSAGNWYCFGHKANVIGTAGNDIVDDLDGDHYSAGVKVLPLAPGEPRVFVMLAGNDRIDENASGDYVCTGKGDDYVGPEYSAQAIDMGPGKDSTGALCAPLVYGSDGDDHLSEECPGKIYGGNGNDVIYGDEWNNPYAPNGDNTTQIIHGGIGNDTIHAGGGKDKLFGDDGNDIIDGGYNTDTCTGGAGYDTYSSCEVVYSDGYDSGVPVTTTTVRQY